MQPHEIKVAVVSRMMTDGIFVDSQWAEVDTVARKVGADDRQVREEIMDWMVDNPDCPVVKVSRTEVALLRKRRKAVDFIRRHGGDDDLPGELGDL